MDVLNKFAKASTEGSTSVEPGSNSASNGPSAADLNRGQDLIKQAGTKLSDSESAAKQGNLTNVDNSNQSSVQDAQANDGFVVHEPDSWSKESALKEVKKLREENKQYRVKYQEQVDRLRQESDSRLKAKEEEFKQLADAKKELDQIKSDQEDKKRDLTEKIAYRESKIAELTNLVRQKDDEYQSKLFSMENTLKQYQAEKEAESAIYKARVEEELGKVPEKFKEIAGLIVKGAGDPREALTSLSEAKLKGLFEDKTIIVNHSVPGAKDGARATKEGMDAAFKAASDKMTPQQKIREALKAVSGGSQNSVYRKN